MSTSTDHEGDAPERAACSQPADQLYATPGTPDYLHLLLFLNTYNTSQDLSKRTASRIEKYQTGEKTDTERARSEDARLTNYQRTRATLSDGKSRHAPLKTCPLYLVSGYNSSPLLVIRAIWGRSQDTFFKLDRHRGGAHAGAMGPTSRGSSGSSHHTIKINGNHNHNPNMTSSSSSNHPLTDSGTGKRPRSTSTLGLSSPRMTRLRLRLHALSTSVPFRYFRNSSFIPKRKRSITYLFLLLLISFLIFLPGTLNSLFNHLHLPTHLRLPTSPLDPQASAAFSLTKPRLDQSGKEVPDESEGQQEVEIQRSFEEPDFSLLSGKQPHEVGCDVPIVWDPSVSNVSDSISTSISTPNSNSNDNNTGVLVFLGVFSAAQSSDKSPAEMRRRRDLYRQIYFPQFPKNLVTAKFILGLPPGGAGKDKFRNPAAAVSRARVLRGLEEEREEFGDMVILDVSRCWSLPYHRPGLLRSFLAFS